MAWYAHTYEQSSESWELWCSLGIFESKIGFWKSSIEIVLILLKYGIGQNLWKYHEQLKKKQGGGNHWTNQSRVTSSNYYFWTYYVKASEEDCIVRKVERKEEDE